MKPNEENEAVLAAVNPLLGYGIFVFLRMPGSWRVLKSPEPPECNALAREAVRVGFRWVTSGFTRVLLLNQEKSQAYPLFVETREFRDDSRPLEHIRKRFQKIEDKHEVVEKAQLRISGHEARYIIWRSRRRLLLKRKRVPMVHLECATYCNFTRRLLTFRVSSSHVENFMRDLEKILAILSSASCHT